MQSHQVIEELKILPANLRCYIIECNTLVILVDERGRDGAIQDLVKDCRLLRHCPAETESLQYSNFPQFCFIPLLGNLKCCIWDCLE